jgi:hypothetical protein
MLTFIADNPPPLRKEKALEALDASLRLNPGQEEINTSWLIRSRKADIKRS